MEILINANLIKEMYDRCQPYEGDGCGGGNCKLVGGDGICYQD